jgi:riboflavin kinase, archaea type
MLGKIISGLGQGKHFMQMPKYVEQFQEKLGFLPFAGTLNIKISEKMVMTKPIAVITGFEKDSQAFGQINCHQALLNSKNVIIIIPENTQHPSNVIEVIHEKNLRTVLNLKDGDKVNLEVIL